LAKRPRPRRRAGTREITVGGGLGGALATVIVWVADTFFDTTITTNVAASMAFLLIAAGGWIGNRFK
jgi:hypothetical protein